MEPDIPIGALVFYSEKFFQSQLRRGSRVIVEIPDDPGSRTIMEVAALPGDVVTVSKGLIEINSTPTRFQDVKPAFSQLKWIDNVKTGPGRMTIPKDHYFVLGVNSDLARDGRYWGPIPIDRVFGLVIRIENPK